MQGMTRSRRGNKTVKRQKGRDIFGELRNNLYL
jgi:hypothetical protein